MYAAGNCQSAAVADRKEGRKERREEGKKERISNLAATLAEIIFHSSNDCECLCLDG